MRVAPSRLSGFKIIGEQDARGVLADVGTTLQGAIATSESPDKHHAVIAIVQRILKGQERRASLGQ